MPYLSPQMEAHRLGYLYALRGAYLQQLRMLVGITDLIFTVVAFIPLVAMLAWMASRSEDHALVPYLSVGGFLMVMWNASLARMGFALSGEFALGTLEHTISSRTPLFLVLFAKSLAVMSGTFPASVIALLVILLLPGDIPRVSNPLLVLISVAIGMFGVLAVGFVFTPLLLLVQGRPGFFNAIMPLGVVLSGFVYPVSLLPPSAEIVARFLPTSWAMDAVAYSIDGNGSTWKIISDWGVALGFALVYLTLTFLLARIVETRIRVAGDLAFN